MKRLIIDAQVFHTPAFHRGMGKYSVELLKALVESNETTRQWDVIELLLSARMPMGDEVMRTIASVIGGATITRLPLKKDIIYEAQAIMRHNRRVVDRYITDLQRRNTEEQIDFLILSPLQGGICSVFPSHPSVKKALICYDLIPFLFHKTYFRNPIARIENLTKLTELLTADTFLTISQTVANDLAVHLGVDPARIRNIDGGAINHSKKSRKLSVPTPFILMPTGNDLRKNNQTGILGFAEFNKRHNNVYTLVITSFFDPAEVAAFSKMAPNIVFTGNISGDELNYLYETCDALLFPSLYEGLGLPVLEAAEKGKPVACSDIAVFREMSKTAFTYFDPKLGTAVARALETAISASVDTKEYTRVLARYNWKRTVQLAAEAILGVARPGGGAAKPRVAIVGVNPTCVHPVARLMQTAYAELSRRLTISYRLEGEDAIDGPRPNMLHFVSGSQQIEGRLPINLADCDEAVYLLANISENNKTLFAALAHPGIVCLFDLSLDQAWQALAEATLIASSRLDAEYLLQQKFGKNTKTQLLCSVLAHQKAIVVFNADDAVAVRSLLQRLGSSAPVYTLSLPSSSLVYDDTIPKKEAVLVGFDPKEPFSWLSNANKRTYKRQIIVGPGTVVADGVEEVVVAGDLEYEDALSRATASCVGDTSEVYALDGMRYGVVPLRDENVEGLNATLMALADVAVYDNTAAAVRQKLAQNNTYCQFAVALLEIITKQPKEGL